MSDSGGDSDVAESGRKRIRQACLNCRKKKVRCSGKKPVCSFCSRLSQACVYVEDGRSNKRAHSAPSSDEEAMDLVVGEFRARLTTLDDRLERVENALQGIIPLLQTLSSSNQTQSQFTPQSQNQSFNPSHSNDIVITASHPSPPPFHSKPAAISVPPVHTLLFAADVYFRFCHNQPYSLFHEASLRQRLTSGQLPIHLVWALLAAARRFSTLPDLQESISGDALSLVKLSWESLKLPWDGAENDQEAVAVIQTIVLLVNIEHPAGHCTSAYMKLGFALRIALHSRIHAEAQTDLDPIFREERKRTFWSVYLQDKLISLSRERSPVLQDEVCRIRLPCSESAFKEGREEDCPTLDCFTGEHIEENAAERCNSLALIVVMASALNRASQYALHESRYSELGAPWSSASPYTSISALLLQLEVHFNLMEPAGEALKRNSFIQHETTDHRTTGSFVYAKALFHLAHCLLHHPFLLHQRLRHLKQKAPMSFSKTAWNACRSHAKSLTALKDLRNYNVLILPSLYGYCAMIAGTIHALSMNDKDPTVENEASLYFNSALEFLQDLSRYWSHATLMATRLERFRQMKSHGFLIDNNGPNYENNNNNNSPSVDVMWQSVDYALLSTPTRPGSPSRVEDPQSALDLEFSPTQLFDFPGTDFGSLQPVGLGDLDLVDVHGNLGLM